MPSGPRLSSARSRAQKKRSANKKGTETHHRVSLSRAVFNIFTRARARPLFDSRQSWLKGALTDVTGGQSAGAGWGPRHSVLERAVRALVSKRRAG